MRTDGFERKRGQVIVAEGIAASIDRSLAMHRVALWLSGAMENSEHNPLRGADFNRTPTWRADEMYNIITTSGRKLLETIHSAFSRIDSRRKAAERLSSASVVEFS